MMKTGSLPPISAALALSITMLEVERDACGMEVCRTQRVGPMRFKLDATSNRPMTPNEITVANIEAAIVLAEMCRACPFTDCELKTWPFTRAPS